MRWLVEVSRVSDGSSSEQYCIDARRWQSALQEVRRLRGDEGPLPKLTIELLDAGYRAVDPELKVRYVVTEAPADMPVTAGAQVRHTTQPPPGDLTKFSIPAAAKTPDIPSPSAAPPAAQSASPSATDAEAPVKELPAQVIRQREESPTAESPIHYRELALAVKPGAPKDGVEALMRGRLEQTRVAMNLGEAQQYIQIAVFDHMFVKRPVRAPIATLAWKNWRGEPVLAFPGFAQKPDSSRPTASTRAPSWNEGASPSAPPEAAKAPSVAPVPVVAVGNAPAASVAPVPAAVAPVVVAPVVVAPVVATGAPAAIPRPNAPSPPAAARSSVIPAPVVSVGVASSPPAAPPPAAAPTRTEPLSADDIASSPGGDEIPVPLVAKAHKSSDDLEISVEVGPSSSDGVDIEVPPPSAPVVEVALESMPASEIPVSTAPAPSPVASPIPSPVPQKRPGSIPPGTPRRRAPGEDLIGDLFERMHELSFMPDMVAGADFVLRVLAELIPCEGILIHVFDLGKREFVVVRAMGPDSKGALLHRTPDGDSLVKSVMSRRGALALDGAPTSVPPASSSVQKLGLAPRAVLAGAARLGGRYLGLIELVNPAGGTPFHDGEANALDYVCEQFAEFVASRPIILDADVVVGAQ